VDYKKLEAETDKVFQERIAKKAPKSSITKEETTEYIGPANEIGIFPLILFRPEEQVCSIKDLAELHGIILAEDYLQFVKSRFDKAEANGKGLTWDHFSAEVRLDPTDPDECYIIKPDRMLVWLSRDKFTEE